VIRDSSRAPRITCGAFLTSARLELLVEFAGGAGDENAAGDAALAVLDALYDARGLAALGAIGALGGVHYFLTVSSLGDLGHWFSQFFLWCEFILPYVGNRQRSAVRSQPLTSVAECGLLNAIQETDHFHPIFRIDSGSGVT
jgi:hypothetical protein